METTGTEWIGIYNQIQSILVELRGQLVNPDGSFTTDGNVHMIASKTEVYYEGAPSHLFYLFRWQFQDWKHSDQTGCNNNVNRDALDSGTVSLLTQIFHS